MLRTRIICRSSARSAGRAHDAGHACPLGARMAVASATTRSMLRWLGLTAGLKPYLGAGSPRDRCMVRHSRHHACSSASSGAGRIFCGRPRGRLGGGSSAVIAGAAVWTGRAFDAGRLPAPRIRSSTHWSISSSYQATALSASCTRMGNFPACCHRQSEASEGFPQRRFTSPRRISFLALRFEMSSLRRDIDNPVPVELKCREWV
jgi:hypothetical protein